MHITKNSDIILTMNNFDQIDECKARLDRWLNRDCTHSLSRCIYPTYSLYTYPISNKAIKATLIICGKERITLKHLVWSRNMKMVVYRQLTCLNATLKIISVRYADI